MDHVSFTKSYSATFELFRSSFTNLIFFLLVCQRIDASNANLSSETQFIAYPPPVQFAQPPLQYISTGRGHIPVPPPDVTVQTAQNVPLSTFNYNAELDGQLV